MTVAQFVRRLESYYGLSYDRRGQLQIIGDYLSLRSGAYLAALAETVIRHHSGQYGKLPDIAVFEECAQEAKERLFSANRALPAPVETPTEEERERVAAELRRLADKLTYRAPVAEDAKDAERRARQAYLDWATSEEGWPIPADNPRVPE